MHVKSAYAGVDGFREFLEFDDEICSKKKRNLKLCAMSIIFAYFVVAAGWICTDH